METQRRIADTQQSAIYCAESLVWWGQRFATVGAAQVFVDSVLATPLWRRRKPSVSQVMVVTPDRFPEADARRGHVIRVKEGAEFHWYMVLPDAALNARYVLHELAHILTQAPSEEAHGPRFARTYLALLGVFLDLKVARTLRMFYLAHGVEW